MVLVEVGLICFSLVSCVGICCGAYYLSEQRKAEIQQAGIDRRAAGRMTSTASDHAREWWEPVLEKLAGNEEVMKMVTPYIPALMEKFGNIKK